MSEMIETEVSASVANITELDYHGQHIINILKLHLRIVKTFS